ncbi:MAG TPA: beta-propeller fold lactonase family protein [Mycobacterium sp.]|nr:beta-propeller fold lactonase family protein [Mycobacterium sp.]
MSSASNVTRVGGLAVALGLGAAVATGHGVAAADPSDSDSSDSSASAKSTSESSDKTSESPAPPSNSSTDNAATELAPKVTEPEAAEPDNRAKPAAKKRRVSQLADASVARASGVAPRRTPTDASEVAKDQPDENATTPPTVLSTNTVSARRSVAEPDPVIAPAPPTSRVTQLSFASAAEANSPTSTKPVRPVGPPPLAELVFAAFRRLQSTFFNKTPTARPVQTSQAASGVLTGNVNAADADGDPLTYKVTRPAAHGTVAVSADGTYTYTPGDDFAASGATDTFVVTISEANGASHLHGPADLFNRLLRIISIGLFDPPDASTIQREITVHASVVTTNIPVGKFPHDPSVRPVTGSHVYIANDDGTISVIDTATNTVVKSITINQGRLGDVAVSPGGTYAYVTGGSGSNTLSVIDTATNTVTGTMQFGSIPDEIGFSPDGSFAYIFNEGPTNVAVVDTETRTVVATIDIAATTGPTDLAVRPDGKRVYVANNFERTLSVIDTDPLHIGYRTVIKTIPLDRPNGVAVSRDGTRVYVSHEFSGQQLGNTVSVIDSATNTVIDTITVGAKPSAMAVSPDGSRLYVTNSGDDTVSVVDTATNSVVATIPVGAVPNGVAVSPDGSRIYVTNRVLINGDPVFAVSVIRR